MFTKYLALVALACSWPAAQFSDWDGIHGNGNFGFHRYLDEECFQEMGMDDLHNPHCKTWKHSEPFHSFVYTYEQQIESDKPDDYHCIVSAYENAHCVGTPINVAWIGEASQTLDMCVRISADRVPAGARSADVKCWEK